VRRRASPLDRVGRFSHCGSPAGAAGPHRQREGQSTENGPIPQANEVSPSRQSTFARPRNSCFTVARLTGIRQGKSGSARAKRRFEDPRLAAPSRRNASLCCIGAPRPWFCGRIWPQRPSLPALGSSRPNTDSRTNPAADSVFPAARIRQPMGRASVSVAHKSELAVRQQLSARANRGAAKKMQHHWGLKSSLAPRLSLHPSGTPSPARWILDKRVYLIQKPSAVPLGRGLIRVMRRFCFRRSAAMPRLCKPHSHAERDSAGREASSRRGEAVPMKVSVEPGPDLVRRCCLRGRRGIAADLAGSLPSRE